jgi:hypothetical protein
MSPNWCARNTAQRHCFWGFTTYAGTVTAASEWDASAEKKQVRSALVGSHEGLFHRTGLRNFFLDLRGDKRWLSDTFDRARLERRSASSICPNQREGAITSTRGCNNNLMLWSTWMKRARWNLWSERRNGKQANPRRHIRSRYKGHCLSAGR